MKSVILFALVALVAAGPVQKRPMVMSTPEKLVAMPETYPSSGIEYKEQFGPGQYGFGDFEYGLEGNTYHVPQYIAYQFYQAQKLGYTPSQVSQHLLEYGFPQYVAQYLAQQYEAGLSQPYFRSPYEIFQYYFKTGVPQESQQYIAQQIALAYRQFQRYYTQYGQKAYEQDYSEIPRPFSQYIFEQGKYYTQNGVTNFAAKFAYQQLQQAEQFARSALQYFVKSGVPEQTYQYVYEQLTLGLEYVQKAEAIYHTYQSYKGYYVPYYVAQYYVEQAQQAYQYFFNAYQYIQKQGYTYLPQYFVQQVQYAYLAAEKAYQFYQQAHYSQSFYKGSFPSYEGSFSGYQGAYPSYQGSYPSYYSYGSEYYQSAYYYKQVLHYIETVQQYLQRQGALPQSSYIYQQLSQAYRAYETAYRFYQTRYVAEPFVNFAQKQVQQAYQYLNTAYKAAQEGGEQYVVENLRYALEAAQKLVGQSYYGVGYQYGQGYQYGSNYGSEYSLKQVYEYAEKSLHYIQEQVSQGAISQEYASYIIQQLEKILEYSRYPYTSGYEVAFRQVQVYYQNILQYLRKEANIPQYIVQYFTQYLGYFFQQGQYYSQSYPTGGQGYLQSLIKKYFNKDSQYPGYYGYQYGSYEPYSTSEYEYTPSYGYYGPYSSSAYQYGGYGPYSSYGYQYSPYSHDSSYSAYQYKPYSSYGTYSPSTYQYGSYGKSTYSYEPYSSYGYQYSPYSKTSGYYEPYSYEPYSSYGHQYSPYSKTSGYYGPYSPSAYQFGSYGTSNYSYEPYSVYGYQYGPYSKSSGYYGPYQSGEYESYSKYEPSSYFYGKTGTYSPYQYGSYGTYGYKTHQDSYPYAYSGSYAPIAAAAA